MQLRNKYYPYPVIIEGGEYYSGASFSSTVTQVIEGYNLRLQLSVKLDDKKLLEMVDSGDVIYAHHIECPQTCFRRIIKTKDTQSEFIIKDADVNGLVQVCTFLIANKDIEKYTNNAFSSDYRGWKFNIEKGCVLAVGNQFNIRVNKQKDDFANTASIISIVKNTDPNETTISVDLSQQKIIISVPEITYNQYDSIQSYIDVQPVMHSMLIVPAISYALTELRRAGDQLFEYEENRWYRGLKKACKAIGVDIDEESLKTIDVVKIPQLLMDSPIAKAIAYCAIGGGTHEN